jgi:putative hydrolase of the HAD superfamily
VRRITHLIFDLDNTLYPPARGVVDHVDALINDFMIARLGLSPESARATRVRYRDQHGTTLNGLMLHDHVAPDEFLAHVHAIDIDHLLEPDPALRAMLDDLPHTKIVFTNGSATHAQRVLARLDVRRCFDAVYSLEDVRYVPKPFPGAFEALLAAVRAIPERCLAIDDRIENLHTAHGLGMSTMLVGAATPPDDTIDFAVPSVLELSAALPEREPG